MVWFAQHSIEPVPGAPAVHMECPNCAGDRDHVVLDQPTGIGFGLPFSKRPLVSSHRKHYLGCPVCGFLHVLEKHHTAQILAHRDRTPRLVPVYHGHDVSFEIPREDPR